MDGLNKIKEDLISMIRYPPEDHPRRTEDGYPLEVIYDRFAYKRMIDSYRDAAKEILEKLEGVINEK